ncbi:MAG: hypothetical protein WD042_15470 [Phycisphaeraceae bacterium]
MFRMIVYGRALHPELFELQGRRLARHGDYEVETWLLSAGHVVRFQFNGECLTEVVMENGDHLPEHGLVHALPCLGEKDYEMPAQGNLGYVTSIQTESLTDNLYNATLIEMRDFAAETNSMSFEWKDGENVPCLSVIDCQKFKKQYHIQSYHLLGCTGVVLRTQSIFEILNKG